MFMGALESSLTHWSDERRNGHKTFSKTPTYTLPMRTSAWQWFQSNAKQVKNEQGKKVIRLKNCVEHDEDDNFTLIYLSARGGPTINKSTLQQRQRRFKSLEALEAHYFGIHEIAFKHCDWTKSTCICVSFLKKFACKHIYAIACFKKLASFDEECKQIPLGTKRGPGRPRKTKANEALLRDDKPAKRRKQT